MRVLTMYKIQISNHAFNFMLGHVSFQTVKMLKESEYIVSKRLSYMNVSSLICHPPHMSPTPAHSTCVTPPRPGGGLVHNGALLNIRGEVDCARPRVGLMTA